MPLINTDAIYQEINKQVLAGVLDGIPAVTASMTKAIYAESPIIEALLHGKSVILHIEPIKLEIPPITLRLEAGK